VKTPLRQAYATLFFGGYNEATGQFHYVNCGHPPALIVRSNGDVEQLGATSTVLGLFIASECTIAETRLDSGDTLVLYTDGVTECVDVAGEEFGIDRLTAGPILFT
jgi:sigma-B regulation protein RsbU (phosphoserine phosphatase)